MNIKKMILMVLCPLYMFGDSEFTVTKKQTPVKQSKVTVEDCVQEILEGQKIVARHLQYMGQIQSLELQMGQDVIDDAGVLKKAKQPQLQEFMAHKKKSNQARLEYEQALKYERDFLKQFEQDVLNTQAKNKK